MIDLHCHALPGMDDGPADLEGSLALARVAQAGGTRVLVATPHVNRRYPTEPAAMHEGVERLNASLGEAGLEVQIAPGAEIALEMLGRLSDDDLRELALGGGPNVLLEAPLAAVGMELEAAVERIQAVGFGVVLAHPERCPSFHRDPDRLARLVGRGVYTSLTAGSFEGRFGRPVRRLTEELARRGLVHDVASDAHDAEHRPPLMRAPLLAAEPALPGLSEQIDWLTELVPRALLEGAPPPPAPALPATRRRGLRLPWKSVPGAG